MDQANHLIWIGAALVAASILASTLASRSGTPLLLVFLLLGMLAGEDGPGGIVFNDFQTAYLIGTVALGIILFDGGMRTKWETVRIIIWPGVLLATLGVVLTACVVAVFAVWLFDFNWLQALLLGSIVGSTDAAAVFFLLNAHGLAWIGLRGAVPIILGIFPLFAGVESAKLYFNIAFFVVLVSLLVQGWTVASAARLLQIEVPPASAPVHRFDLDIRGHWDYELLRYDITEDSPALRHAPQNLPLPEQASIAGVVRGERLEAVGRIGELRPGDHVYLMASSQHVDQLNRLFIASHGPERLKEHRFFGDLVLDGEAPIKDVAEFYGLDLPAAGADADSTLDSYLQRAFHRRPVVGDRLKLGRLELVVREMSGGKITRVGFKFR